MTQQSTRRRFLTQLSAAGAVAVGFHLGSASAQSQDSPNEKLNLAVVGVTGRGGANLAGVSKENIVALADVDSSKLNEGAAKVPAARKYADFRTMLEKEADKIDAVVVSTPDHCHAPAAAMALRLKKHVYCEKPLTHTVFEARTLANLAAENKLVTQMGTQIHAGGNYRRVVELVQSGAIGEVREVHVWASADYSGGKLAKPKDPPKNLRWDLWQGPAAERPYHEGVHPFHWRRFWDYGTGGLGDFGCHYMDLAFWALQLREPTIISCDGPKPDDISCSANLRVEYEFPQRGELPPVKLTWYDGNRRPDLLSELKDAQGKPLNWNSGQLFVGKERMILSNYSKHLLLPEDKFADFERPEPTIPDSIGHHAEWLHGIRTGDATTCNFDYSGRLTEAVLLGVVAHRSGETIRWNANDLKTIGSDHAQQFVHKEYRQGWDL